MRWSKLLGSDRLARPGYQAAPGRSSFQQDLDRIVFSASFRRLANKTQVHPLAENDHIHNRLTHSIETGSVGRSLGTMVGSRLCTSLSEKEIDFSPDDFGCIVQAACMAHDIGNPPFGHAGEDAIGEWFKQEINEKAGIFQELSGVEKAELSSFEGNAQGFRILTQLENRKWAGGLQLTHAVLGAFMKYPRPAYPRLKKAGSYKGFKKFGYFSSEKNYVDEIASALEMKALGEETGYWYRHPLAFLVEAADDICYNIVDLEDAILMADLHYENVVSLLEPLAPSLVFEKHMGEESRIAYMRAVAIDNVINEVVEIFCENQDSLLDGTFTTDLVSQTKYAKAFTDIQQTASKRIFTTQLKTEREISGRKVIHGILDIYKQVISSLKDNDWKSEKIPPHIKRLIRYANLDFREANDLYKATLVVTDFVSGMTDRYSKDTYKILSGHF